MNPNFQGAPGVPPMLQLPQPSTLPQLPTHQVPPMLLPQPNVPQITIPPPESFDSEAMQGSMQQILSDNIGIYSTVEFLVGTQSLMRKDGFIYSVGRTYVILYEDRLQHYVVCDIFSVRFVTFYPPGTKPPLQSRATTNAPVPASTTTNGNRAFR